MAKWDKPRDWSVGSTWPRPPFTPPVRYVSEHDAVEVRQLANFVDALEAAYLRGEWSSNIELAAWANLASDQVVSRLRNGDEWPALKTLLRISAALGWGLLPMEPVDEVNGFYAEVQAVSHVSTPHSRAAEAAGG